MNCSKILLKRSPAQLIEMLKKKHEKLDQELHTFHVLLLDTVKSVSENREHINIMLSETLPQIQTLFIKLNQQLDAELKVKNKKLS